jgi:hypothetical protein
MEMTLNSLQTHALALASEFARQKPVQLDVAWSNEEVAKDRNSLEFKLPRQTGSSLICHFLCHEFDCLTVLPNQYMLDDFLAEHKKLFPDHQPKLTTIYALKRETNLICKEFDHLKMISDALRTSKVVLFDAFRVYSDNSAVRKLMHELGRSHRFIIFK